MPTLYDTIAPQESISRTQQKRAAKQAAKAAKSSQDHHTDPPTAPPPGTLPPAKRAHPSSHSQPTPSTDPKRRALELLFLQKRAPLIPSRKHLVFQKLLRCKPSTHNTAVLRFRDDIWRRRMVDYLLRQRTKAGLENDGKHMDLFESAARQNFEGWGKSEEVLRGLMVEKLEIMCSAFYGRVATGAVLRVDAECDLLVVTLALKGRGGIPVNRIQWLKDLLSPEKVPPMGQDYQHVEFPWQLGRNQAIEYIAACRRRNKEKGKLERYHSHKGQYFEIHEHWKPEELEEDDWTTHYDVDTDDEDEAAEYRKKWKARLASYDRSASDPESSVLKQQGNDDHESDGAIEAKEGRSPTGEYDL